MGKLKTVFSKSYNSSPYSYIIFIIIIGIIFIDISIERHDKKYSNRIAVMETDLLIIRKVLEIYYYENGKYPESLSVFRSGDPNNNDYYLNELNERYIDLKSEKQEYVPEYRELNNKGGYYYDPNTGNIRVNLTEPVSKYLPYYYGRRRSSIPSEW